MEQQRYSSRGGHKWNTKVYFVLGGYGWYNKDLVSRGGHKCNTKVYFVVGGRGRNNKGLVSSERPEIEYKSFLSCARPRVEQ
jgi:hypothetical protein